MENEMWQLLYPSSMDELQRLDPSIIKISKGEPLDLSQNPVIEELVDKEWERREFKAKTEGGVLFPGPQFRLSGFEVEEGPKLNLHLAPSDYKEFIGTHGLAFDSPALFNLIRQEGLKEGDELKYFANVLAECTVIKTIDNYILMTWRSPKVAEYGNTWHTVGGHPNPKRYQDPKNFDPNLIIPEKIDLATDMAIEIEKETGIPRDSYELYFLGLVRNMETLKPEIVYFADVNVRLADIITYPRAERYELIEFFGLNPDGVADLIARKRKQFTPPGLAGYDMLVHLEGIEIQSLFIDSEANNNGYENS